MYIIKLFTNNNFKKFIKSIQKEYNLCYTINSIEKREVY